MQPPLWRVEQGGRRNRMRAKPKVRARDYVMLTWFFLSLCLIAIGPALAESGTDFPGTVLMVEPAAGKLSVKKDGGGTRFTFVVNDKRSEEHTSNSSHTVISYAVFCLKKKNKKKQ